MTAALAAAVLLAGCGGLLVAPALRSPPAPAHPWALWIGTDARDKRVSQTPPSWLLRLWIQADEGCAQPVMVRGELQIGRAYKLARSPRHLVLSVAGVRVHAAEVNGILSFHPGPAPLWRRAAVSHEGDDYVIHADLRNRIDRRLWVGRVLLFRFRAAASQDVGHEACSMTSPALSGGAGENQLWYQANTVGEAWLSKRGRAPTPTMDDAIVHMSMPDRIPDRSELDGGARAHGASLLLTCSAGFRRFLSLPVGGDDFSTMRARGAQPSCASLQTFRAADAAEDLNRRLFLAGALISAAVGILLTFAAVPGSLRRRMEEFTRDLRSH